MKANALTHFSESGSFRPLGAMDAEAFVSLAQQTYLESYPSSFSPEEIKSFFTIESFLQDLRDDIYYLGVFIEGVLIGYAKIIFLTEGPKLDKLYIQQKYQGMRLGKELLEQCCDKLSSDGHSELSLTVWNENLKAIKFYTHNGFAITGETKFIIGDKVFSDHTMRRELTPASRPSIGAAAR